MRFHHNFINYLNEPKNRHIALGHEIKKLKDNKNLNNF